MCDTVLASPAQTAHHSMLFGKNSDRRRNEPQVVELVHAADHHPGSSVNCTYILIPQARRTHAVLLCRPFWIWGAEMGANEHGVVIGNEAVHARSPAPEQSALVGMDLVRLGLERATSAAEALEVITKLLERHGQGGNCGHLTPTYYNNAFMIADPNEAFVLETIGREWLVERVRGIRTIANDYSIARDVERASAGLPDLLREFGYPDGSAAHYAQAIGNPHREHIGQACARRTRTATLLGAKQGRLEVADILSVLRDHGPWEEQQGVWSPHTARTNSACMHAGADERPGQTTCSLVAEVHAKDSVCWVTATAAPCISIFKPVLMDVPLPAHGLAPTDQFDARALWWQHERMHRRALIADFPKFLEGIREARDALELDFRARVSAVLRGGNSVERARVVAECWRQAIEVEGRWSTRLTSEASQDGTAYQKAWSSMNRLAGFS